MFDCSDRKRYKELDAFANLSLYCQGSLANEIPEVFWSFMLSKVCSRLQVLKMYITVNIQICTIAGRKQLQTFVILDSDLCH